MFCDSLNIFLIHLLGDGISPSIIGFISDQTDSLTWGMMVVPLMAVVAVAVLLTGSVMTCEPVFVEDHLS